MERTRLSLVRVHWLTTEASARHCATSASMRPVRSNGSLRQGVVWSRQSTNCLPAHFERMILGLQAAYVEEIPARLQPEFGQHFRALHFADFGAVGDEDA